MKKGKNEVIVHNNGIAKSVKNILEQELIGIGSSTGSLFFYQPKEPKGLEKYKNVK